MKKSLIRSIFVTTSLLLIPLLGMQVSSEIKWDKSEFVIMGILIFITTYIFTQTMQKIRTTNHKVWAGIGIILVFLYVWAELAVGIFTNLGS